MKKIFFANKLMFFIFICQLFISKTFASNNSEDMLEKKIFDSSKPATTGIQESNNNSEIGDFGIIKDVVGEAKIIKKSPDSDDDKIFLNKEIFNQKTKEALRKIVDQIPKIETQKLKFTNRIISDLSLTDHFKNTNSQNEFRDTNTIIRYYSNIKINTNFEIYGLARIARFDNDEDVARRERTNKTNNSRTFENLGINLSELNIKYSKDNSSLIAGKFTTNFGTAWRWNKGIFIHSVAQDYALTEKLGFTGITKYGDLKKTGLYNFSLSLFTNDRKNFDNSLFHRKNSDSKSQAIAGDTRSLSSFTLATDINFEFNNKEKLSYHIAYSKLDINRKIASAHIQSALKKQAGAVFGINYKFPIKENFNFETILEYAKIKNINGDSNASSQYFTSNFILKYLSNYSMMIGNSNNKNKNRFASGNSINISEINIGYEFDKNRFFDKLTTQIGYYQTLNKNIDNVGNKNKSFALLVRYYKNF